jgi:hypothetical protein
MRPEPALAVPLAARTASGDRIVGASLGVGLGERTWGELIVPSATAAAPSW